jgi:predicted DNA-binding protein (UPF0251 family)
LHSHIQPNTFGKVTWLCFDCDEAGSAVEWRFHKLPPPTLVMENRSNGHAHLAYALETPVPRTTLSRAKPLFYMEAITEGLRRVLKGDAGYRGGLIKTPGHAAWETTSFAGQYSLGELADYVELPSPADLRRLKDPEFAGLGRNCQMFERLRIYGYQAVRNYWKPNGFEYFSAELEKRAAEWNRGENPLPTSEVRSLARSQARWIWTKFSSKSFVDRQAALGKRKGSVVREAMLPVARLLHSNGMKQREIAARCGVDQKTISNWLKKEAILTSSS